MNRLVRPAVALFAVALGMSALAQPALAQRAGFVRLIRPYHQVVLATLPEVEKDLKLTDEQKTKAGELAAKLKEERGALFQEAAGDIESIREDMNKLNNDIAKEFNDALDEAQRTRLGEIFAQTNGPTALFDDTVAVALKLTDEQKTKLGEARQAAFGDFQGVDWQSLSEEESDKKVDEIIGTQNDRYTAVMTDAQKADFEKMQGKKLEIDLANLPNPFGG